MWLWSRLSVKWFRRLKISNWVRSPIFVLLNFWINWRGKEDNEDSTCIWIEKGERGKGKLDCFSIVELYSVTENIHFWTELERNFSSSEFIFRNISWILESYFLFNNCNIFLWFCIMNLLMFQNEYSNDVNEQFLEIQILTENREIFHYSSIFIA